MVAETPAERRAAAVAALVLAQVAERGGTPIDRRALLTIAERALHTFDKADRAAVFDEMVSVLDWLADHLRRKEDDGRGGDFSMPPDRRGDVDFDPGPVLSRLHEAIDAAEDVVLDYFSFHRKAWSERRVTPKRIIGEFLVADCHMRGDERRFRVTRIRGIRPASDAPPAAAEGDAPPPDSPSDPP